MILTKIAYLLYQSEAFATKEATETFFSITKLFQSPDVGTSFYWIEPRDGEPSPYAGFTTPS